MLIKFITIINKYIIIINLINITLPRTLLVLKNSKILKKKFKTKRIYFVKKNQNLYYF